MTELDPQPGIPPAVEDLPPGKAKIWMPPRSPTLVTVVNTNDQHNMAHRDGTFEVKFDGETAWEGHALEWHESQSFDTGYKPFAVRNTGRIGLTIDYQ
jgi:hypothetical protein